ncbi:hypothetical protein KQI84_19365 [bacterium]|nr:hypothetical protein [bacterium]
MITSTLGSTIYITVQVGSETKLQEHVNNDDVPIEEDPTIHGIAVVIADEHADFLHCERGIEGWLDSHSVGDVISDVWLFENYQNDIDYPLLITYRGDTTQYLTIDDRIVTEKIEIVRHDIGLG